MDIQNSRVKVQGLPLKKGVGIRTFVLKTSEIGVVALSIKSFCAINMTLMLALRGQMFNCLRETFGRRVMGQVERGTGCT